MRVHGELGSDRMAALGKVSVALIMMTSTMTWGASHAELSVKVVMDG